jgi:hypothetical protein
MERAEEAQDLSLKGLQWLGRCAWRAPGDGTDAIPVARLTALSRPVSSSCDSFMSGS